MVATQAARSPDFPDDPRKWDGWSKYQADNLYERLCLDPRASPTDEQIQQHCYALLQWWHKKLPLKNQPSNPLTQLLGRGLEESSHYLVQARMQLLDPARRRQMDNDLAAQAEEEALAEFAKYVAFSVTGGVLSLEAEANLTEFGQRNGLEDEQIRSCIDEAVQRNNARRAAPGAAATPEETPGAPTTAEAEFIHILRLSEVNLFSATDTVRLILANIAQNLGIDPEEAECLLDDYLDEAELALGKPTVRGGGAAVQPRIASPSPAMAAPKPSAQPIRPVIGKAAPSPARANFVNPLGAPMVLIPAGEFVMGSDAVDSAPNERPLTPVKLTAFYMSHHPVTNAQYEQFDRSHRPKRTKEAGDHHPVVYVTNLEAAKYCQWLGQTDGKKYRLPTEAEWEYAARGTDGRKYPWGNDESRGDLGNFADASTTFPWRDLGIDDGHAESSPVGAFPRGASSFGLEDMAGNVWEWCLDFFQPLAGVPKQNPRGASTGSKRVYRGGSWKSRFANLRATARASNAPTYSCNDLGFRIVCECGPEESR